RARRQNLPLHRCRRHHGDRGDERCAAGECRAAVRALELGRGVMPRCALGLDFGTESVRALIVDVANGAELGTAVSAYAHGVIESTLPDRSEPLPHDWALQDPADYWIGIERAVPEAARQAGIAAIDIIGIGIDFTSCTLLPVTAKGVPLCFEERWR